MTGTDGRTVLVVDDDPDVVRTYRHYLADEYDVITAADGSEGLSVLDSADVDVVLLDRRMPGLSGDEVLDRIRAEDGDCRVAIVTAVDPDFDIVDMGFDAYVTKPTSRGELLRTVEQLGSLDRYADRVREYHSLLTKRATLRAEKSQHELDGSGVYADLQARIDELAVDLDDVGETVEDDATFVAAIRAIERTGTDAGARRDD